MSLLDIVKELETKTLEERREAICSYLAKLSVPFHVQNYETGQNIIVNEAKKSYVGVSCHYDTVPGSPGANDNASGVAVTLDLIKRIKESPTRNIGVKFFFFDEEENGLLGSQEHLRQTGVNGMLGLYNFEMVGAGDSKVGIWPVPSNAKTPLVTELEKTAKEQGKEIWRFHHIDSISDHANFNRLVEAFTITAITDEDLKIAREYIRALNQKAGLSERTQILSSAPLFKHYHQPTDTSEHLNENSLQMVSNLVYESIRGLDKAK